MRTDVTWARQAVFLPQPREVSAVRAFVRQHLLNQDLTDVVDDAVSVASELAANAVVHARTAFAVTVGQERVSAYVSIRDSSPRPLYSQRMPVTATHGRGLHVVRGCSSAWGVANEADGGKTVWASFQIDDTDSSRVDLGVH